MWWFRKTKKRKRVSSVTKHYLAHKEQARALTRARLHHFSHHYNLKWNRVAIRNQRRCWGSCSSKGNLNFNYKILFLPPHLQDYIIVHEMCHLRELNHGRSFWALVAEQIPDYPRYVAELKAIDRLGHSVAVLKRIQNHYQKIAVAPSTPHLDTATDFQPSALTSECNDILINNLKVEPSLNQNHT